MQRGSHQLSKKLADHQLSNLMVELTTGYWLEKENLKWKMHGPRQLQNQKNNKNARGENIDKENMLNSKWLHNNNYNNNKWCLSINNKCRCSSIEVQLTNLVHKIQWKVVLWMLRKWMVH